MTTANDRDRCERWFVRQGLPQLIDDYSATEDVLTRMTPFLAAVVFFEFFLAFGDRWQGWSQALAFLAGIGFLIGAVVMVNRIRGRRPFQLPDDIGLLELALYLIVPAVPAALGAQHGVTSNIATIIGSNLALLVIGYVVTSWGLLPMLRWAIGQLRSQIGQVFTLSMKSLPTLLLFSAFIFLNAEMWQVANDFTLPFFAMVTALIVGIGSGFVSVSAHRLTVDLARFDQWSDVRDRCESTPVAAMVPTDHDPAPDAPALGRGAEWNVGLRLFVAQGIQIALVAVVITMFYVLFGLLTVRADTLMQWTTATELSRGGDWALYWSVLGGEVVFTRQLLLVAAFIGMMSGLQFGVQIMTDQPYREEFAADMTAEIRQALAVRAVYLRQLVSASSAQDSAIT